MNDYKTTKEFIKFGLLENIEEFEVVSTTILYNKDDKENDIIRIECTHQDGKEFTREYYKTKYDEFITNNRNEKINKLLDED